MVYSSSAELVLAHSAKTPSPTDQLLPERSGVLDEYWKPCESRAELAEPWVNGLKLVAVAATVEAVRRT